MTEIYLKAYAIAYREYLGSQTSPPKKGDLVYARDECHPLKVTKRRRGCLYVIDPKGNESVLYQSQFVPDEAMRHAIFLLIIENKSVEFYPS